MFKKIIVPLDRSFHAEEALPQAASLVRKSRGELRLLLAHQPVPYAGFDDIPWTPDEANKEIEYLQAIVDELALIQVSATCAVHKGEPIEVICREAHDSRADLIVMSSHGRSGLSRMWLGSVADGVVRHSPVPVLIIRPSEKETGHDGASVSMSRLLVTLDGSTLADEIIPQASALAKLEGAQITLLRIVQPVPWIAPATNIPYAYSPAIYDETITQTLSDAATAELEPVKKRLELKGHAVDVHVIVANNVARSIIDFAARERVDAIAMATHGRGASRFLLGSVADKVLRAAEVPVMLHRPRSIRADGRFEDRKKEDKVSAA